MATFGNARLGAGGTVAAAITQIGADITLPAGGPWTIWGIYAHAVLRTVTVAQNLVGSIQLVALSGDLDPDPSPGFWPAAAHGNASGATPGVAAVPLNIWPVNYTAAGKAVLRLNYINHDINTVAPNVLAGILYGDKLPEYAPCQFSSPVTAVFAAAVETAVGTVTLAEKAKKIVGVYSFFAHDAAATASEECHGFIRLDSPDVKLQPAEYPNNIGFSAGLGAMIGNSATPQSQYIPLDIDVPGGAAINIFATTSIAVTANARVTVWLAYI
jgi:hypothetical protein